jgi:hypothetical protein
MILSLIVSMDGLAVCKLAADAAIPAWATAVSQPGLCSITRTSEELSIVCLQELVPKNNEAILSMETGWVCLKVEGPLDFGLTGILASLAAHLAAAKIPIFAMSTYNTDYLLVKQDLIDKAIQVLEDAGQFVITVLPKQGNGAATSFAEDVAFVRPLKDESSREKWPDTFGLVVVAGWPPPSLVQQEYH